MSSLAPMAHWLTMMLCTLVEGQLFFRRRHLTWAAWAVKSKMPLGIAAPTEFSLGMPGAVLGMVQMHFVGALAVASGCACIGLRMSCGLTLVSFTFLRRVESKRCG